MALRALIIGGGERGRQWVTHLRSHPSWTVGAMIEPRSDTRDRLERDHPDLTVRPELEDGLVLGHDAVVVATPPDQHVAPTEWSLREDLAVLVEKPFALSVRDASRLVGLAEKREVPLLVAQNYRYRPDVVAARRAIAQGHLGEVGMIVGSYYMASLSSPSTDSPLLHRILWGMGVHHLDAFRYCLDAPISRITVSSSTLPWSAPPMGSTMSILLEFGSQITGVYAASYDSRGHEFFKRGQEFYARFMGSAGSLHLWHKWAFLFRAGRLPRPISRARGPAPEMTLLDQLALSIRDGTPAECSGRDNLLTVAALEASVLSAETSTSVSPTKLLDEDA